VIAAWLFACVSVPPSEPVRASPPSPAPSDAIYFVLVDRFANGAPDAPGTTSPADPQGFHGGDLVGVIDQLDHIQGMGFGAVWLSPITEMRTEKIDEWGAFHGYWVADLAALEPRFGTMKHAQDLSDGLRERGMDLYLDMVYNHVGYDTPMVSEHPEWFHGRGDISDWSDEVQVRTHDVHGLPDLVQDRDEVYAHLLSSSAYWIAQLRPKGFRVDAVRHLDAGFLARLADDLHKTAGEDFELMGEVFEGDPTRLARAQSDDRLSSVFDFPLHYAMRDVFCDGQPMGRIASILAQDALYGTGSPPLVTFLDNHDLPRIGDCSRAPLALAFLLTARGRPAITYGTENRALGTEEPDNRSDMVFGLAHPMASDIRTWLGLRSSSAAARRGRTVTHELTPQWMLQSRQIDDEALLIAVNLSEQAVAVSPATHLGPVEVLSSWTVDIRTHVTDTDPGMKNASVAPQSMRVWQLRGAFPEKVSKMATLDIQVIHTPDTGPAVLVGAGALGGWDPKQGVIGKRVGEGRTSFSLQRPVGDVLAYKLAIATDDTTWEDRPNRYLLVTGDASLTHTWGQ
jgi:glycosidase